MDKFLFVLSRGLEDPTRVVRCLQLAKIAADKGHQVNLFLVDDAVAAARLGGLESVKAPTGDEAQPYLDFLVEKEVPIPVCTPCANARALDPDEFVVGARLETGMTLIDLAAESKAFSF